MKKKKPSQQTRRDTGILLIAVFKLLKAALLLAAGIGILTLLHKDVAGALVNFLSVLHVDHNNHYIHGMIMKIGLMSDQKLEAISAGSFFYAALIGTEGVGLLLKKHWAEYLTIIATASFIPLEIYELIEHFGAGKIVVLIINLAIVAYLIYKVRYDPIHKQQHKRSH
ncbi:MAG: DUF2127 domain-containing protein [Acidobacteriota bacterium]|nr:DUF2127 domain-containing protein [Acidobacteriota bacterium]